MYTVKIRSKTNLKYIFLNKKAFSTHDLFYIGSGRLGDRRRGSFFQDIAGGNQKKYKTSNNKQKETLHTYVSIM